MSRLARSWRYHIFMRSHHSARRLGHLLKEFWRNPFEAIKTWPRLQIWAMVTSALFVGLDIWGAIPERYAWTAFPAFLIFIFLVYAHIRTVHTECRNVRDEQITSQAVLEFIKSDVIQLRDRIDASAESVCTRAGEDLRIAMAHGLFRDSKYAAFWSTIKVAENSPTTGTLRPLGCAVFILAISWWEQQAHLGINADDKDRLRWGLGRFEEELALRIDQLSQKLGE